MAATLNAMRDVEAIFKEVEKVPDFYGHKIDSVSYKNGYGDSPLHIVASWGDTEAIEILVLAGADINAKGETGFTPLHYAAEQNRPAAILKLLQLGAKAIENDDGETPLELAKNLKNTEAIDVLAKSI